MHEYGRVEIAGKWYKAVRYTDTGIVHVYKSRRPLRVSRQIAKTFVKDADNE